MVDRLDHEVGRIIAQLRKMDVLNNTVIFFLSDNGASAESHGAWGWSDQTPRSDRRSLTYA